ncbi:MAG TPA: BTAD domain-containing putative transcriptional regulator [Gemmatimonadaceae bacterium]|nr:BTAD domain-containing putative transcriptional regulator [Gemmatimonadaceae bacterium]
MTIRLRTFGSVYLTDNETILSGPAGQRRLLAILTVLAVAGERGVSRDKLLALLWPEGEPDKARHALTQSIYHIKKALGVERIFVNGTDLRLNPDALSSDVGDFQRFALECRWHEAISAYTGPFLDGFYLNGGPEFDFWVSEERDRLGRQYSEILTRLADDAKASCDVMKELRWRQKLVDHDPLDGAAVAKLMACLSSNGDRTDALRRARSYEDRMRDELDLPPDRVVADLIAELRSDGAIPVDTNGSAASQATVEAAPANADHRSVTTSMIGVAGVAGPGWRAESTNRRRRRRGLWWGAVAAVLAIGVVTRVAASHMANDRVAIRASRIVVAPFHFAASDPTGVYLREGLLDLLTTRIAAADTRRPADPAHVLQVWRAAGYAADSATSVSAASRLARSLDAGEVVIGSVETTAAGVVVHASLVDAVHARVKVKVDVRGSSDSLITLVDRIVSALVLTEFGERVVELPQPATESPQALRAYLAGRAAFRRADYYGAVRAYTQAMTQDPKFAVAALGLAISADRVNSAEQHDRGLAIAWARQSDLSPADRAYLRAFAGPRYPEPSSAAEALAAWERVVRVAPDRAEGWHELGESFYYDAEVLGMTDGASRAADAFRHSLSLDPSFLPSRRMLTLLLARQADTTALRQLRSTGPAVDTMDAANVFVRWRAANAMSDNRALERVRRAFDDAPNGALRSIAMTSQFDGVSVDDGDRALEILRHRSLSDAEEIDVALARHSRALNSAQFGAALSITDDVGVRQPALHPQLRLRVLDALYSRGDHAAAQAASARLDSLVVDNPAATMPDSAVRLADLCVLGQWRLAERDTAAARAAVRELRRGSAPRFPVPVGANPTACAELLDASLAIAERGVAARDRLAHLDSLMLSGPAVGDAMRYANLVVARQYQSIGDPAHALAALRRRSYMRGWPRYRATGLQLQTELALQLGDTAAARSAQQRLAATLRPPRVAERQSGFVRRLRALSRSVLH